MTRRETHCGMHLFSDENQYGYLRPELGPGDLPDRDSFWRNADQQDGSPFFQRLPLEVRQRIYETTWEQAGIVRHIIMKDSRFTHVPCVADHDAPADERQVELERQGAWKPGVGAGNDEDGQHQPYLDPVWARRLLSTWSNHWRCEEAAMDAMVAAEGRELTSTPFIPILLCCKRMYLETRTRLYEKLTFTFHQASTAASFFCYLHSPITAEVRHLQIAVSIGWRLDPELWPGSRANPNSFGEHREEWNFLRFDLLKRAPNLRRLSIWVDACDYREREKLLRNWGHEDAELFSFDPRLLSILTLSIPVNEGVGAEAGGQAEATWLERQSWVRKREHTRFWAYHFRFPAVFSRPEDVEELASVDGGYGSECEDTVPLFD